MSITTRKRIPILLNNINNNNNNNNNDNNTTDNDFQSVTYTKDNEVEENDEYDIEHNNSIKYNKRFTKNNTTIKNKNSIASTLYSNITIHRIIYLIIGLLVISILSLILFWLLVFTCINCIEFYRYFNEEFYLLLSSVYNNSNTSNTYSIPAYKTNNV
jgi:hypothetical protein